MNCKWIVMGLIVLAMAVSCRNMIIGFGIFSTDPEKQIEELKEWDRKREERMIRKKDPSYFYGFLYENRVDMVRRCLESGADPNECRGEFGWMDSNPLKVLTESFYNTYDYENQMPKILTETAPDVAIIKLLIDAGADINRLPYVWDRVHRCGNGYISTYIRDIGERDVFIQDANRVLAALLEAGADPDKLGHPYPFSNDWRKLRSFTDKKAHKYFEKGTRAINEAIEKGIVWESQVDLLLQYTKLDEESLKAAERSNDPAMVEKIKSLWEEQQSGVRRQR